MSDNPGNNSPPRDNRSGGRPRNNNRNRRPRRDDRRGENRRDSHSDDRRPRQSQRDDRRDNRPDDRPQRKAPAAPTVWQKLLTILTFGLVRPKGAPRRPAPKPKPPQEAARPPREVKSSVAVPPADPEAVDSERLHIGNLHYDASESDLLDLFKGVGPVKEVDIVYNGRTHRSKGFGFVQMATINDARRAVSDLHGQMYMGRPLILGPARSRGEDKREADED